MEGKRKAGAAAAILAGILLAFVSTFYTPVEFLSHALQLSENWSRVVLLETSIGLFLCKLFISAER